jgi:hypothetical protein
MALKSDSASPLKNQAVLSRAIEPEIPPLLAFLRIIGFIAAVKDLAEFLGLIDLDLIQIKQSLQRRHRLFPGLNILLGA